MPKVQTKTLRLILGDQLNPGHPWFKQKKNSVDYLMMEVKQEADYVLHHIQKICGFFLAMRQFSDWLKSKGHNVFYLKLDDKANQHDFSENLKTLVRKNNYNCFEYILPDEYRVDQQLKKIAKSLPCETEVIGGQHFLTERDEVAEFFRNRKEYRMEYFYRHMRRKHDILMEDDKPVGGKWNYDIENRSKYRGEVSLPDILEFKNDATDVYNMLGKCRIKYFGKIRPDKFIWPVNRQQALKLLNHFIKYRLTHFGTYQDAMLSENWSLFHSRVSFALNIKLLHPLEVIEKAINGWESQPQKISLAQIEGFVRQILGWREYMRGIYWKLMPEFAGMNFFDHKRKLPGYYWDGNTNMNCMAHAIGQSLEHAYAHHIQRLMITGNFALIAGVEPVLVDAWYLGVYIDAIEWVEMPNTRGMSQFADGGITASKPYVSTANYINSMSDYCKSCKYSYKVRFGDDACPFNSLYWDFFNRHRKKLNSNPRIAPMFKTWDRMDRSAKQNILKQARKYLDKLDEL